MFLLGGAHAIAAFAYGTKTVPRADRIVGPGNIYVAAAKKLLAGEVGIDFIAGPTEILMIASEGEPAVDRRRHARASRARCGGFRDSSHDLQAAGASRRKGNRQATRHTADRQIARKAIDKNSAIILVKSIAEACGHQQPVCA